MILVMLDTNVYIIGVANLIKKIDSAETTILESAIKGKIKCILSKELEDQIKAVAKRTESKDRAGYILDIIWSEIHPEYILKEYYIPIFRSL